MSAASVLVVDDDRFVLEAWGDLLRQEGYHVGLAETGHEAIQMMLVREYDVAVTDIYLPDCSGLEILRRMRRESPSTEIIVITGNKSYETAIEAWRSGALDYLEKPIELPRMKARVREVIEAKGLQGSLSMEEIRGRYSLTPREMTVLQHVLRGLSNRAIAATMYVQEGTVKNHLTRVFGKFNVCNRKELLVKLRNVE